MKVDRNAFYNKQLKIIAAVCVLTTLMTWFFYAHESFPKPLRALTALFATPVAVASGLSHYFKLGIDIYNTLWAVVLSNLIFSIVFIYLANKFFNKNKL